jgi:hypothetical protein
MKSSEKYLKVKLDEKRTDRNILHRILGTIPNKARVAEMMGTIPQTFGYMIKKHDRNLKLGNIMDCLKATDSTKVTITIHEDGAVELLRLDE